MKSEGERTVAGMEGKYKAGRHHAGLDFTSVRSWVLATCAII